MGRLVKILLLGLLLSLAGGVGAQAQTSLIAPNVFLRGIQLPEGVRYTASLIKPSDDALLRNLSVEITLPANVSLTEMLISRQIEFDVVRQNSAGKLTLIWQISNVPAENPLDSFSFTLAQSLTEELEFYAAWQDEDGIQRFENFLELPSVVDATQSSGQAVSTQGGFLPVGSTGVQISASGLDTTLTANLLSADFNPPAEFGNLWWCSLLELVGLPAGTSADVIVPLRRPLAPLTAIQLFHQQPDGNWLALDRQGIVTADGQYAMYVHPGGVIATGVPIELQSEVVTAAEIVIVLEDVTIQPPDPQPISVLGQITDGSSNTIIIGEVTPPTAAPPLATNVGQITDGSSNTILLGEAPPTTPLEQPIDDTGQITDGSSNTVFIGEGTPEAQTVTAIPTGGDFADATNAGQTLVGRPPTSTGATAAPIIIFPSTTSPTSGVSTPGQVLIIGGTNPPTSVIPVTSTVGQPPTNSVGQITDGSSNTILLGESTPGQSPTASGGAVRPTGQPPTSTLGQITDGSSNTILIGQTTPTPPFFFATLTPSTSPQPPTSTPVTVPVIPNPFGQGGGRLEIIVENSGTIVQCQFGRVNCANLRRRLGGGLR